MRVLVACETSGRVRDAFIARGHEAMSCDLLDTEAEGPHAACRRNVGRRSRTGACTAGAQSLNPMGNATRLARPPCSAGLQQVGVSFVLELARAPIPRVCLENPVGVLSSLWRKPDQIIQPWQYGHGETKATCLWLSGLPPLVPTNVVPGREARCHRLPPSPDRWKLRSATYPGIASAMAAQWSPSESR